MQGIRACIKAAAGAAAAAAATAAPAGSPLPGTAYTVTGAELTDRRGGEVEFWHQEVSAAGAPDTVGSYGALTARGTGDWQLTAGLGTQGVEGRDASAFATLEGLWLWREPRRDGYGLGLAAGADYGISDHESRDHYLLVPATVDWGQRTTLHANLGGLYDEPDAETDGLWGLGLDWRLTEHWDVVLEASGDTRSGTDDRGVLGVRRGMLDDLVQLEIAYGRDFDASADDELYLGLSVSALRF